MADSEVGVGASDTTLVALSITGFCLLGAVLWFVRTQTVETVTDDSIAESDVDLMKADVATLNRAQRRRRAHAIMKEQRRLSKNTTLDGDAAVPGELQQQQPTTAEPHLSRKERQRRAKTVEREERILQQDAMMKQQAKQEQIQARQRAEREEQKLRQSKRNAERHATEQRLEQLAWETFLFGEETRLTVKDWRDSLSVSNRVVSLLDLADKYGTSSEYVAERIQELLEQERVTGILQRSEDTFLYLEESELAELARRIQQRARDAIVSLQDIALIANEYLHLTEDGQIASPAYRGA